MMMEISFFVDSPFFGKWEGSSELKVWIPNYLKFLQVSKRKGIIKSWALCLIEIRVKRSKVFEGSIVGLKVQDGNPIYAQMRRPLKDDWGSLVDVWMNQWWKRAWGCLEALRCPPSLVMISFVQDSSIQTLPKAKPRALHSKLRRFKDNWL